MVNQDNPDHNTHSKLYFASGFGVGAVCIALILLDTIAVGEMNPVPAILLVASGGLGFGLASAHWGDSAWYWLAKWLRRLT